MKSQTFFSVPAFAAAIFAFQISGLNAADTTPNKDKDNDSRYSALEQKIELLEKRVHDLEGQLTERAIPLDRRQLNQMQVPDMDAMMEELRKMAGNNSLNGPQGLLPYISQHHGPRTNLQRKPRLGVELDVVSPELSERFKNTVTEGAFVMSVVPGSSADKAGVKVGDAIVSFDGKAVTDPRGLIDAVKNAPQGPREMDVSRRGEKLSLKVELGAETAADIQNDPALSLDDQGWLRQGPPDLGNTQTQTELKVSALDLTDALALELKLDDKQKSTAREVLAKHQQALSAEFEKSGGVHEKARGNSLHFSMNGNLNELAQKQADAAATELAAIFNPDQLKHWNEHRAKHNSISFSQVIKSDSKLPALKPLKDEDNAADAKF